MNKNTLIFLLRWVITSLVLFTFTVLPTVVSNSSVNTAQDQSILIRIFYSIMLAHPYIKAAQVISNRPGSPKTSLQAFSKFLRKNSSLEFLIGQAGYILIGTVVMFLAVKSIFGNLMILHYIAIILYIGSIGLLDMAIINEGV